MRDKPTEDCFKFYTYEKEEEKAKQKILTENKNIDLSKEYFKMEEKDGYYCLKYTDLILKLEERVIECNEKGDKFIYLKDESFDYS
ncbi:MAG: hypothetical protein WED07_12695 [Candidatus Freyarchaeum deiterrae]